MKRLTTMAIAIASAGMLLAGSVQAGNALFGARVGGKDAAALAKFYEAAFGLKQVARIEIPNSYEIMMNFGDTDDAAKAAPGARIIVMNNDAGGGGDLKDPLAHLLFNVTDMNATMAAIKAAGGSVEGKPMTFGQAGILIGNAKDPDGNRIEMVQMPARP